MCSRRHFLRSAGLSMLLGPALLEESIMAAAQARAADATSPSGGDLFDLKQVADGVYAALARPQQFINSNACVIVNGDDIMVVDTHSKPSAAKALIGQIRREISDKPVRYVVNTHFHWDHAQGNHAYPSSFPAPVEILASEATRQALIDHGKSRLQASVESVPKQVEGLRSKLAKAGDARQRAELNALIAQAEAYAREMQGVQIDLPTITFNDTMVLQKKNREIHLLLLGRGHTAGDVVVYLPREKVVATGDLAHGFLPYIGDGYPKEWPATVRKLINVDFQRVSPGHGGVQEGKRVMTSFANYIEELTGLVEAGVKKGRTVEQLQKEISAKSLKSLQADNYGEVLAANFRQHVPASQFEGGLDDGVRANVVDVFKRLGT